MSKRYDVIVTETYSVEVEADSREEAKELAMEQRYGNTPSISISYIEEAEEQDDEEEGDE